MEVFVKLPYGFLFKRINGNFYPADSKRSGIFYFSNPDAAGKRHDISLKTKDREEAECRVIEMCGQVRMTNQQEWLKSLVSLGKWAEGQLDVSLRTVTPIDDVWEAYRESRKRPASGESTLKHYQVIWNQFARWLAEQPVSGRISALDDLPEKFCEKYTAYLEQKRKVSTVTKHLVVLKLIFRILCPNIQNPWKDIRVMKVETLEEKKRKRALEPKEVKRLIVSCRSLYEDSPILGSDEVEICEKRYREY